METIAAAWRMSWLRRVLLLFVEFPSAILMVSLGETLVTALAVIGWNWLVHNHEIAWPSMNFCFVAFAIIAGINALAVYFVYLPSCLHFTKQDQAVMG